MKIPIITLSNGLKVANFSSPHSFTFTDGSVLPACSNERSIKYSLIVNEDKLFNVKNNIAFTDVNISFTLDKESIRELDKLHKRTDIDIIICSLPVISAIKYANLDLEYITIGKCRCIRVANRITKEIEINKFCV